MAKRNDDEPKEMAIKPAIPSSRDTSVSKWRPDQLDPELANIALAREMVALMGPPSIVDKPFIIRKALAVGLNHIPPTMQERKKKVMMYDFDTQKDVEETITELFMAHPGNPTGYDSSLRVRIYKEVESASVNINGAYLEKFWAYLCKPKYIINGMPMGNNTFEEDKGESLIGRLVNFMRGGKKQETNGGNQ
jgi:hypothetical protein